MWILAMERHDISLPVEARPIARAVWTESHPFAKGHTELMCWLPDAWTLPS